MMNCYLGLDIGTTGIKSVVFDSCGTPLGIGLTEYTLDTPRPDIVELDPEQYWRAACAAIREAITKANIVPETIRALSVTGQAETIVMVDGDGKPLRKAIVWLDNRASEEAKAIEARFGAEALFRLSGQTEMLPCWPAAKLLWYRNHEPELFAKTAKYLMVEDYIVHKLTGKYSTCKGLMPSTLYYDIRTGVYDKAMLEYLQLSEEQLPQLCDCGAVQGVCVANESMVPAGALVAAAPLDHVCGNLGSGCAGSGMISETTGCTLALCAAFPKIVYDEQRRISTYLGYEPGSYVLLPWAPTAGMLLKYFRDEFTTGMSYDDFNVVAAAVPPGSEGLILLPHCAGAVSPVCNPEARGVAYGVTLAHKREHWIRAIMESVAYLLRDNVEVLRQLGAKITSIHALGGASKSELWLQIMADVLNLPITITACEEATSLGAAILAAVAVGDFANTTEAAKKMVREIKAITPGDNAKLYDDFFRKYQNLNKLLMPTFGGKL